MQKYWWIFVRSLLCSLLFVGGGGASAQSNCLIKEFLSFEIFYRFMLEGIFISILDINMFQVLVEVTNTLCK